MHMTEGEEKVTEAPTKKPRDKKKDAIALTYYGEGFDGFMKVGEIAAFLPAFKELWYQMKIKDQSAGIVAIVQAFNASIAPEKFHPYPSQIRFWTTKWKKDLLQQMGYKENTSIIPTKDVHQVISTRARGSQGIYATPDDQSLEAGIRTLGGEILNDALQMLRDDQDMEEMIDGEELIKRRNYIVNVFSQVTKMTHGKAMLMLKASEEKRENASFLMDLLRKAASGEIKPEDLALLKATPTPVAPAEEPAPVSA